MSRPPRQPRGAVPALSLCASPAPASPSEDEEIADVVRGFLAVQARAAADQSRPLARGTHAKGVCVSGVFEVLDVRESGESPLGERLAVGLYARPGSYRATVRFANSAQHTRSDWVPDVRSLSFSIDLGSTPELTGVRRQDFALQSAPTLPFDDLHAFAVFARVMSKPNEAVAAGSLPFRDQLVFARTRRQVLEQQRQPVRPYQLLRYWSNVAFRHGDRDVVKYSLRPASANHANPLQLRNPCALRDELARHLTQDQPPAAFDFALQFLDVARMTHQGRRRDPAFWIEHPSVEWPERQAPFHVVGRLHLLPVAPIDTHAAEQMYIDVTEHTFQEHAPLGAVNRARWHAQVASRTARQAACDTAGSPGGRC